MNEATLLKRITVDPGLLGGKPIIRCRRLAVEHVLAMLAAGDTADAILGCYPWLEREDILACLAFARCLVGRERYEPLSLDEAAHAQTALDCAGNTTPGEHRNGMEGSSRNRP